MHPPVHRLHMATHTSREGSCKCHAESFTSMLLKAQSYCWGCLLAARIPRLRSQKLHFHLQHSDDLKRLLFSKSVRDVPTPTMAMFNTCSPKTLNDTVVSGPSSSKLCREPDLHTSRRTEHQND